MLLFSLGIVSDVVFANGHGGFIVIVMGYLAMTIMYHEMKVKFIRNLTI